MSFLKKPTIIILLIGIIIRLFLSSITFHSDIQHFDLAGYVISQGNLLKFYDYPASQFNYPPVVYFSLGIIDWLFTGWEDRDFHNNFLFDFQKTIGDSRLYLHLILLKIPYLPFDMMIAYLLYNLFSLRREKILAFSLWIFNPWVLYSTYMIGQFDVIPTAFVTLSIYTVYKISNLKKGIFLGATFLGIGASFKIFPLLFLLPLAALLAGWSKRALVLLLGVFIYIFTILPFLISPGYRSTALAANQIFKSFYAQIPVSGGESIILFLTFTGFFYLIYLHRTEMKVLWQRFFIILLLFFVFTHFHPQWFLWLTPFLILELLSNNFKHIFLVIAMLITFIGSISLFERSLSIGLFVPLNPSLNEGLNLWKLLNTNFDLNFLKSLFKSLFASLALYFIYYYFPKKSS